MVKCIGQPNTFNLEDALIQFLRLSQQNACIARYLCSPVQFCSVQFCSVLFSSVQLCSALFSSVQFCSVLFNSVHLCSVLFSSVQSCTVLVSLVQSCSCSILVVFYLLYISNVKIRLILVHFALRRFFNYGMFTRIWR